MENWMLYKGNICHVSCDGCNSDTGTNTCKDYEHSLFWANEAQIKLLKHLKARLFSHGLSREYLDDMLAKLKRR